MGKLFEKYILKNSPELAGIFEEKRLDIKFAKNNPEDLLMIKNTFCRGIALARAVCTYKDADTIEDSAGIDDEPDALRHFIISAFMTCNRGEKYAGQIMTAHEGSPPWQKDSQMDVHNNFVGIDWASDPKTSHCKIFREVDVVKAALKALAEGKLVVLSKGKSSCADGKSAWLEIDKLSEEAFGERTRKGHFGVSKAVSACH